VPQFEGSFLSLSKDEWVELKEKTKPAYQEWHKAFQEIVQQVARLQGRNRLKGEGERYLIISTNELKQIQESATKEKAQTTSELVERMITGGSEREFGGRQVRGSRSQGSQRSRIDQQQ